MFQDDMTLQQQLFAFTPRDLLPDDSDVWLYVDLFDSLNLEEFEWDYSSQGQAAKDPRLMLRTLFYGLAHGISSARALTVACRHDVRFIVLCGERQPDARTFHRFIRRHENRMANLFTQVVQLAMKMGLAKLGRVAIDGSRIKANSSKHKAMSYGRMEKAAEELKEQLIDLKKDLAKESEEGKQYSEIPDEISRREKRLEKINAAKAALESEKGGKVKAKDQKSFNDHDALPMAGKGEKFQYGYNTQAAVDEDNQIIVGCTVHENQADSGAVETLLDEVSNNCNEDPSEVLADSAYGSGKDLKAIETTGATPYVSTGKGECAQRGTVDDQLTAGEGNHEYYCQAGKMLPVTTRRGDGSTEVTVAKAFCSGCPYQNDCKLFGKKGKTYTIRPRSEWQAVQANRQRLRHEGKGVFRRRKAIVEPVFGNVKTKNLKIHVSGGHKVRVWWTMVCLALNLEKIVNHLADLSSEGLLEAVSGYRSATTLCESNGNLDISFGKLKLAFFEILKIFAGVHSRSECAPAS